jgi:PucR family transcriptional regulator, purine catabolism regulatory protein
MLLAGEGGNKVHSVNQMSIAVGRSVMKMSLDEVLRHRSVQRGEPVLLVGAEAGSRSVRWVHSSEVIDIAPLLRGGELLLTGGVVLSEVSPSRQRSYVRDLAARGVTALAVETASTGLGVPDALIDECAKHGFPLIRFDRPVPFVEITEGINGLIINDSVQRLRLADSISDALSAELTSGAGLQELTGALADLTGAAVVVRDRSGAVLSRAPERGAGDAGEVVTWRATVAVHGISTANLEVLAAPGADRLVLEAALGRAPQAFALALLRAQPPTPRMRATRALFQHLRDPSAAHDDLDVLLANSGLAGTDAFVAVVTGGDDPGVREALEQQLQRNGRMAVGHADEQEYLALVALDARRPERSRRDLIDDVRQLGVLGPEHPAVGIGPLVSGSGGIPHAVAEARRCLQLDLADGSTPRVVDAADWSLHRLVHQLDADEVLQRFIREQLGALLDEPSETRDRLLRTLEVFFDCGANKTQAAERLHVRRQTLYQRLDKLSASLGIDVTDPEKLGDLHVAVRLRNALTGRGRG